MVGVLSARQDAADIEGRAALRAALDGVGPLAGIDYPRALKPVDLSDLANAVANPVDYAVEALLPRRYLTLFGGHGGSGKSTVALTLAAHIVAGREWAGLYFAKLPVVFISLEDEGDLVRYRLKKIADHYGLSHSDLAAGLTILDGTDFPTLATVNNAFGEKTLITTNAMTEVKEAVTGAGVIFVDNSSDAYDGDINDPAMVRAFLRELIKIARSSDSALCLLAHIDKASAKYGSMGNSYTGTTAWHNTARSRLALVVGDDGTFELRQEKLNLGKKADPISLEWTDRGVPQPIRFGVVARDDEIMVLQAIRGALADGGKVSTSISGAFSAARSLEPYLPPEFAGSKGKRRVDRAIVALSAAGKIRRETYRTSDRKDRERWTLAQVQADED